jgi:hypothetical protein
MSFPSEVQQNIITAKGNLVVSASAGTGKTATMVEKIAIEIDNNNTHRVIAAITFTIKAAQEIRDRLRVEVSRHFIGTTNTFVIEEVIKPFAKDVLGAEYDLDIDTNYSIQFESYEDGLKEMLSNHVLGSYIDNKKNFIFDLATKIIRESKACRLYFKAKYFKIYIDEYQDCDEDMNAFFMYLADTLKIEMFIVGDDKQGIYIWRGAYPEAFRAIGMKSNFNSLRLYENHRSCKQIQNYSNLLFDTTKDLYEKINTEDIYWTRVNISETWSDKIVKLLDLSKSLALLRYSNDNARNGADDLKNSGCECVYIPRIPLSEITTNSAWLYMAIAKYVILTKYTAYDLISEIPVEGDSLHIAAGNVKRHIDKILKYRNKEEFFNFTKELFKYLKCCSRDEHIDLLFDTINDSSMQVAFQVEKYNHLSMTLHSSKGLEFDQVIVFAEDYRLNELSGLNNHYVATTRAKEKLIIVRTQCGNANNFATKIQEIINRNGASLADIVSVY